jgi:hypothetical protein
MIILVNREDNSKRLMEGEIETKNLSTKSKRNLKGKLLQKL